MLVLTRTIGETVVIIDNETGHRVRVAVLNRKNGRTRLGFETTKKYTILREELLGENDAGDKQAESNGVQKPTCPTHLPEGFDYL